MNKQELIDKIAALSAMELDEKGVVELEDLNGKLAAVKAKEEAAKLLKQQREQEDVEREANQKKAIAEALKAEREKWEAEAGRLPTGDGPYQTKYHDTAKYDNLSGVELSLLIDTLKSAGRQPRPEAYKAMAERVADLKAPENTEEAQRGVNYVKNAFKAAFGGLTPTPENKDAAMKAATDPMYSGGSNIGSDWVGTEYSRELWRVIRAAVQVASRVPEIIVPDGYSSVTVPLQSTDPTWYKVAEASASDGTLKVPAATVTASQAATANKNITLGKMGARVLYTGELVEDSLINFVGELRQQLQESGAEILESLIIDGDSDLSSSTNINDIAGTPAATDYFLICDGFRKLPLVTNTANSRSAAGGLVIEDYIDTLKLMGTAGLSGSNLNQVAFIVDPNTHYANMKLPEVKTRDVFSAATIENGFVTRMYNVPVIPSWNMHRVATAAGYERKANSAGKVDVDTTSNNLYGAIVAVRFDQWKQAYKRRMTMETTRIANADSWEIVALARWGLAYRDTEASAISYYVGV